MKLYPEQLKQHLEKQLAPLYLISGDEPLLKQEACDTLREQTKKVGFSEITRFDVDASFDWEQVLQETISLSLFAEKRLIEVHMNTAKLGKPGQQALLNYIENPSEDVILLVTLAKLDGSTAKTAWFKTLDKIAVHVPVWPIDSDKMPGWLRARMRRYNLSADNTTLQYLTERLEGNLLAAAQAIEFIHLLQQDGPITQDTVESAIANNARYDIFKLVDASLQADKKRLLRTMTGLQQEGVEAIVVLWALVREIRSLSKMAQELSNSTLANVIAKYHVWPKRKVLISAALQRHSEKKWQSFLQVASQIDEMIKGARQGNAWHAIQRLCFAIAGVPLLQVKRRRV